jgi:hypothetical protein
MGRQGSKTHRPRDEPQSLTKIPTGIEMTTIPSGARLSELHAQSSTERFHAETGARKEGEA